MVERKHVVVSCTCGRLVAIYPSVPEYMVGRVVANVAPVVVCHCGGHDGSSRTKVVASDEELSEIIWEHRKADPDTTNAPPPPPAPKPKRKLPPSTKARTPGTPEGENPKLQPREEQKPAESPEASDG